MQPRQMKSRLTNYYIGVQIAFVFISWLANSATGISFSNIFTQLLLVETLILAANSFLVYRRFYAIKEDTTQGLLYFTLPLTALVFVVQSATIIWNGFVIYQLPFHVAFLFGFGYSIFLIIKISKAADGTTANRAFVK